MYNSKLASLINDAVRECITYGGGHARCMESGRYIDIYAAWADNEIDIEITVLENGVTCFTFTEEVIKE